jgi:hypothetical protein
MAGTVLASSVVGACTMLPFGTRAPEPAVTVVETPRRPEWQAPFPAAVTPGSEEGAQRLLRLAEVWHAVRWFHPAVATNPAPWDTAYLRHVDRARTAASDDAFAEAVQAMLGELADAETRVVRDTLPSARGGDPLAAVQQLGDGLVLARPVSVGENARLALSARVPRTVAVLDLRGPSSGGVSSWWLRALDAAEYPLPNGTLSAPLRRTVRRTGPDGIRGTERACCASWTLTSSPAVAETATPDALRVRVRPLPSKGQAGEAPPSLVVLVNDDTRLPSMLFTLHAAGYARIVSTGSGVVHSDARAVHLPIGGGYFARVRLEELLLADGHAVPIRADTVIAAPPPATVMPDSLDRAVSLAVAMVRGALAAPSRADTPQRLAIMPTAGLVPSAAQPYPSHPERLLAVSVLWGAARAFNPYLPLSDASWDEAFLRALAEVEAAPNARAFGTSLLRFAATLDASQAELSVLEHPEFGRRVGYVPFRTRLVDRRPIVVSIDDSAAARSGVQVGDEVVAIGGEPIDKRFGRLRELVSGSNAWSREQRLASWFEAGPALVKATFQLRGSSGPPRDVEFSYADAAGVGRAFTMRRQVETLTGGVVRVRLGEAATPLPEDVGRAEAIIVDARGVTTAASLAWLAGSVLDADMRPYARDDRAVLQAPPSVSLRTPELDPERATIRSERTTPRSHGAPFAGPVAVLVDASTAGDGELLALRILAGGTRRVLVGAPTAGAVGEVVTMPLPGGVHVTFPVSEVRHADGRFIQRLGLTPSVTAIPTVLGVRAGRDEVLEAAQRWITQQLAPPPPLRRR